MWMDMFVCCFSSVFCKLLSHFCFSLVTFWQSSFRTFDILARQTKPAAVQVNDTKRRRWTLLHLRSLSICSVWPFLPISSQMPELTDEFSELVRARMAL